MIFCFRSMGRTRGPFQIRAHVRPVLSAILVLSSPAALAQSWSMYDGYSLSYSIPFAPDPRTGQQTPDFSDPQTSMWVDAQIHLPGGRSDRSDIGTFQVDTGSTGMVVPAYLVPDYTPLKTDIVEFSSSGNYAVGSWVMMTVTFSGATPVNGVLPTATVPVFIEAEAHNGGKNHDCTDKKVAQKSCIFQLGIGYGRPGAGADTVKPTPINNPLIHIAGMDGPNAAIRAGYVISQTGIAVGLTGENAGKGFAITKLTRDAQDPIDWQTLPGQFYVNHQQVTSNDAVLVDSGLSYLWANFGGLVTPTHEDCPKEVRDNKTEASFRCAPGKTALTIVLGAPGNPNTVSYSYVQGRDENDPMAPWYTLSNEALGELNTGVHVFAGFTYFYDAAGGFVGFRPIAGMEDHLVFNASLSVTGSLALSDNFSSDIPVYLAGDTSLVTTSVASFMGAVTGGGLLNIAGPGIIFFTGDVTLPSGILVTGGSLSLGAQTAASVSVLAQARLENTGTLTGAVTNGGAFLNAGALIGALSSSGSVQNSGQIQGDVVNSGTFANSGRLSGNLSNTGYFSNDGTLVGALTNSATVQNAGEIQGNVINSGVFMNSGTQTGGVQNSGMLSNGGTLNGPLANSGGAQNDGQILGDVVNGGAFANTGTLTGTFTNTAGAQNAGQIQGNAINSGTFVNSGTLTGALTNTASAQNAGRIEGGVVNSATFLNSGIVIGTFSNSANAQSTGQIQGNVLNTGTFSNDGTVTGTVTNRALLIGNGTVNGDLISSGRVSPGHSIGTIQVNGNVSLASTAVYTAEIGPNGASDLLSATGVIASDGATLQVLALPGFNPTLGSSYTLMTAGGGVVGSFVLDPVHFGTTSSLYPFLAIEVSTANGVSIGLARSPVPFAAFAATPNQMAVAMAADQFSSATPLAAALAGVTATGAPAAFAQLEGDIYASAQSVLQQQSACVRNAVTGRLLQGTASVPAGAGPKAMDMPGISGATVWGQAYAGWGANDGNFNASGTSSSIGGFIMGLDTLLADWRVGFAAGFSQSQFDLDGATSSGESDTYDLALYAGRSFGALNLRFGAAYSWHDLSSRRTVTLPNFAQSYSAGYDGDTAQVFGEVGYGFLFSGLGVPVGIEPFAGLSYVALSTGSFSEGGGAAALTGTGGDFDTLSTTLGVRGAMTIAAGAVPVTLTGTLGWQHAFGDLTPQSTLAFTAGAAPFTIDGAPLASDALIVAAGLSAQVSRNLSLGVSYSGQIASAVTENAVKGSVLWAF